ncbi:MAG TPA: hypothetical protein VNT55_16230 [Baekduia sp.]|nr:hypothetical protein [Baekduia sp.]
MRRRSLGLAAVIAALAATPALAAPSPVTVRVEGATDTLIPRTALTTTTATVNKDGVAGHDCTGTSAAGALEQASGGDWNGTWSSPPLFYSVDAIKGESHLFASGQFWGFFINDALASTGICGAELQTGDSVLLAPISASATSFGVLSVSVPATATLGQPLTVKVTRTKSDFAGPPTREAVAGATVSGGGASATTGADGSAQLVLGTRGPTSLRATDSGNIRSASEPVCVTDGSDGACGGSAASACATTGDDGLCGTKDKRAPRGKIASITEGQRFAKGKGPRSLSGTVAGDPSGIADVRLRLTRNDHGRCQTFDGRSERMVALNRCGAKHGKWFSAGDRERWSYLLPARLGPGRYVLDVQARDRAGNVDTLLQRTRTRVVFIVS